MADSTVFVKLTFIENCFFHLNSTFIVCDPYAVNIFFCLLLPLLSSQISNIQSLLSFTFTGYFS